MQASRGTGFLVAIKGTSKLADETFSFSKQCLTMWIKAIGRSIRRKERYFLAPWDSNHGHLKSSFVHLTAKNCCAVTVNRRLQAPPQEGLQQSSSAPSLRWGTQLGLNLIREEHNIQSEIDAMFPRTLQKSLPKKSFASRVAPQPEFLVKKKRLQAVCQEAVLPYSSMFLEICWLAPRTFFGLAICEHLTTFGPMMDLTDTWGV